MKKLLILSALILPVLALAGCGTKTPEEQAAENLMKWAGGFMKNMIEMWEANKDGHLSDEEMAKKAMWKYADLVANSADGTEDELTDEEKDTVHDMFTEPEKIWDMMNDAIEKDREQN